MRIPFIGDMICFIFDRHDFGSNERCECGESKDAYLKRRKEQNNIIARGPCLVTGEPTAQCDPESEVLVDATPRTTAP